MAGNAEFSISGDENLRKYLRDLPDKYTDKVAKTALRKALAPFVKNLRRASRNAKKAVRVKVKNSKSGPYARAGIWGGGEYRPQWFKEYWQNYGTLQNRSPGHTFKNGIKSKSRGKQGGIRPSGFVEKAWESSKAQVVSGLETEMAKATQDFFKKNKAK